MANAFDPYREALVIETKTVWSPEAQTLVLSDPQRAEVAAWLHAHPADAANLEYLRLTAGFCRQITVTADDVARYREGGRSVSPAESLGPAGTGELPTSPAA